MSKNIYQPSSSTADNQSLSNIPAAANGICEVNTSANSDVVVDWQSERDTLSGMRDFTRRRRLHDRWVKGGRDPRLAQLDLNAVRGNIHALAMPELKRLSMLPNRVERNPLVN